MELVDIFKGFGSVFFNLYSYGMQEGISSGAGQAIDRYVNSWVKMDRPELINAELEESLRLSGPRTFRKIVDRLNKIGEGYSILDRIGSQDPLADIGFSKEMYIDMKTGKIEKSMDLSAPANAILFHLAEISAVVKRYDANGEEEEIKRLCEKILEWCDSTNKVFVIYGGVEWHVRNLIPLAQTGELNPHNFIRYQS